MEIIVGENICFKYMEYQENNEDNEFEALKDVNIRINEGEFIAILGHNGSGKSTLAKQMNGLLIPTKGRIIVGGIDTGKEKELWKIRQLAGMVFQNPDNQIIGTVVDEDVAFGPENLGIPTDEMCRRVDWALEKVNMLDYRYSSPNKLSGGQKQRVAIAGVLAMKPKCIILDEPTAMLDPRGRKEVIEAVTDLNKNDKVTVVLITHYMDEVINADRIFVMDKGEIIMEGKPKDIFKKAKELYDLGLDVPLPALIARKLRDKGVNLPDNIISREELVNSICQLN